MLGGSQPQAEIPFVVEAWARKNPFRFKDRGDLDIAILINRTPSAIESAAWRDGDRDLCLQGSGLIAYAGRTRQKRALTRSRSISPRRIARSRPTARRLILARSQTAILNAVATAMRKAQRAAPKDKKISQKDVVLDNLDDAIAAVSGDGVYRFNTRQIFYQLRPIVLEETGQELKIGNYYGHHHRLRGRERRDSRHVP